MIRQSYVFPLTDYLASKHLAQQRYRDASPARQGFAVEFGEARQQGSQVAMSVT